MKNSYKICIILHGFNNGGVEKFLFNYLSKIKDLNIKFDFVVFESQSELCLNLFKKIANNIFYVTKKKKNFFKYKREMKKIIKEGNYDVVHSNLFIWNDWPLKCAYKYNVPIRISHCHIAKKDNIIEKLVLKINSNAIKKYSTNLIGCSRNACDYLYGKNEGFILPNAFDLSNFYFNSLAREKIRSKYGINNSTIIIGNVGRLSKQKNHELMINIAKIIKEEDNICFLCVGGGELESYLKNQIKKFNLEKKFIFAGESDKTYEFYSAFDLFLFPSLFEGLGISFVEAQISGLPCLISNVIPSEGIVSTRVEKMDLSNSSEEWLIKLKNVIKKYNNCDRINYNLFLTENINNYDINRNVFKLKKIYGIEE